jgi:hypothetical protein
VINFDLMAQEIKFSAFSNKHGPFWARCSPRENSTSSYLCSCIGPLSASHRWATSSHPTTPLLVAWWPAAVMASSSRRVFIGYLVLAKSAKPGGWRRPNDTQSATSNCSTHDPVTRRLLLSTWLQSRLIRLRVWEQSRLRVLEPTSSFFPANGAEGGREVRERPLGPPTHPLAHRGAWRRRAGRGSSAPPLLPSSYAFAFGI